MNPKKYVYQSTANGVFGELLQGTGSNGEPFLITFPVNIFSHAFFRFQPELNKILIDTPRKKKSQDLADKIFEKYQLSAIGGGILQLNTEFSVGKGLASSSADLVASARVINLAYNLQMLPEDIEDMIRGIEPSDGVMYSEVVSFYYKRIKLKKILGKLENVVVVGTDEGGSVDTIEYNKSKREFSEKEKAIYDQLLLDFETAISYQDTLSIGNIATYSGYINQRYNPKKLFEKFLAFKEKFSFCGVVVAHSGTYIGLLIDLLSPSNKAQIHFAKSLILEMGYQPQVFYANHLIHQYEKLFI